MLWAEQGSLCAAARSSRGCRCCDKACIAVTRMATAAAADVLRQPSMPLLLPASSPVPLFPLLARPCSLLQTTSTR